MENIVCTIIPTYNQPEQLSRALQSIFASKDFYNSVIVIDDGSKTIPENDLIIKYQKIQYIWIPHSGLPAIVRNIGIKHSTSKYIAFLDSDDEWCPDKISKQIDILEADSTIGLVCSNAYIAKGGAAQNQTLFFEADFRPSQIGLVDLIKDNFIITSSVVLRRDVLAKAWGFSEEKNFRGIEDYDLWLRVAAITDIRYIHDPLVIYWDMPDSLSASHDMELYWKGLLQSLNNLRRFMETHSRPFPIIASPYFKKKSFLYRQLALLFLKRKQVIKSLFPLVQAIIFYFLSTLYS